MQIEHSSQFVTVDRSSFSGTCFLHTNEDGRTDRNGLAITAVCIARNADVLYMV